MMWGICDTNKHATALLVMEVVRLHNPTTNRPICLLGKTKTNSSLWRTMNYRHDMTHLAARAPHVTSCRKKQKQINTFNSNAKPLSPQPHRTRDTCTPAGCCRPHVDLLTHIRRPGPVARPQITNVLGGLKLAMTMESSKA